jgi:phosphopantothenoylcysteine decarboxylase/phosphopantothenate--cysteine ligase
LLAGKKILVGVTGSIAAYKTAILVRELIKLEAEVKVIMTSASSDFISPLTLATLSKNPVAIEFVKNANGEWENHVELGLWADAFVIAPLTASSLSKLVDGQSDNLLIATYLSARCPIWIAPAMDLDMFQHFSTQHNLKTLRDHGVNIIEPTSGELASGLEGKGRMEEPEIIASHLVEYFMPNGPLKGKNILITGGPTYEAIDPVRFIGNHSSGKTGVLLADECARRGATVTLILGPSIHHTNHSSVHTIHVKTAEEMLTATQQNWQKMHLGIFSAAVADYRPETKADEKIKKKDTTLTITLTKNPDILAWAGQNKSGNQYLVGFALETNNEIENGTEKLKRKNLDLLVLNSLNDTGAGFGFDTNKVTFIKPNNILINFELKQKSKMAIDIVNEIETDLTK